MLIWRLQLYRMVPCPPDPTVRRNPGRPTSRGLFLRTVHGPEKWIPVFGKDHAPQITTRYFRKFGVSSLSEAQGSSIRRPVWEC